MRKATKRTTPHPFGQIVRNLREEKGLSGYALAKKLNKTPDQLRQIERGDCGPSIPTLIQIADALDMDPTALFSLLVVALREEMGECGNR